MMMTSTRRIYQWRIYLLVNPPLVFWVYAVIMMIMIIGEWWWWLSWSGSSTARKEFSFYHKSFKDQKQKEEFLSNGINKRGTTENEGRILTSYYRGLVPVHTGPPPHSLSKRLFKEWCKSLFELKRLLTIPVFLSIPSSSTYGCMYPHAKYSWWIIIRLLSQIEVIVSLSPYMYNYSPNKKDHQRLGYILTVPIRHMFNSIPKLFSWK